MAKPIWFKSKHYGWGWYPSTWQGFAICLVYILLMIYLSKLVQTNPFLFGSHSITFLSLVALLIFSLIWVCYKTGEKPRWRWGK